MRILLYLSNETQQRLVTSFKLPIQIRFAETCDNKSLNLHKIQNQMKNDQRAWRDELGGVGVVRGIAGRVEAGADELPYLAWVNGSSQWIIADD